MDVDRFLYYLVTAIVARDDLEEPFRLRGIDFEGGLSDSSLHTRYEQRLWIVTSRQVVPLNVRWSLAHAQSIGYHFRLSAAPFEELPCFLTSDAEARWVYSGPAILTADDPTFDPRSQYEDAVPLIGREWMGVTAQNAGVLTLRALSTLSDLRLSEADAYCPDWSESLDDPEGPRLRVSATWDK